MARWFTIGMEVAPPTVAESPFFYFEGRATVGANATITRNTTVKRSGAASRAHNSGPSNAAAYTELYWGLQGQNGYYIRIYFLVDQLPSSTVRLMQMADTSIFLASVRLTSGGKIQLWNDTGTPAQIGSDSAATVAANTWYRLELFTKVVAGASDACEARLDGTSVASASGLALSESHVAQVFLGWAGDSPGANKTVYLDDVAVNDDTGATQNTWPGAGNIVYLNPVSDNARTGSWTAGAGATTNLYEAVNNEPPSGLVSPTNASQIIDVTTSDTTGNYDANVQSYSDAGIVSGSTVTVAQSVFQVATNNTVTVSGAIRIVSNPAQGAEESKTMGAGAALGAWPSNWHSLWGTAQVSPGPTLGTQPVLRIGRRGSQATELHCCGMRIAVEYTPGAGGGTTGNLMLLGVG